MNIKVVYIRIDCSALLIVGLAKWPDGEGIDPMKVVTLSSVMSESEPRGEAASDFPLDEAWRHREVSNDRAGHYPILLSDFLMIETLLSPLQPA